MPDDKISVTAYMHRPKPSGPAMDKETRLKRLSYRAHHRGFREADIVLGSFADRELARLTLSELDQFEALLAEDDHELYGWILGRAPAPAAHDNALLARLRQSLGQHLS